MRGLQKTLLSSLRDNGIGEDMFSTARKVGRILSDIPLQVWDEIVKQEPEAKLADQLPKYGFGKFATFMVMAGLNDYQLKGPAEKKYWPLLHKILKETPVPQTTNELKTLLRGFYENERFRKAKVKRLEKFLDSNLAQELWVSNPETVSKNLKEIWTKLAKVMNQKKNAKTIAFAMKTLAITLILSGHHDFDFSGIPIPVDIRVKRLTSKILKKELTDEEVRHFWNEVLREIKKRQPEVNMIHLDSLVWQIGNLADCKEINEYFKEIQVPHVGQELCNLIH
ncbi:N-glycosylase/DNA lyase [Thermococcus nautili]|uniref:Uncharacterized protein conserved in archaea n=1 Tax=Thermococcus nautili TaxID=195522 RepID=W8NVX1_9EURY|nr:N-glycosylase/DNA lyase [Thermococcus nautili]AHL23433.1 Uncharacterized protein conserved in archaea [Thermococcus nautili]